LAIVLFNAIPTGQNLGFCDFFVSDGYSQQDDDVVFYRAVRIGLAKKTGDLISPEVGCMAEVFERRSLASLILIASGILIPFVVFRGHVLSGFAGGIAAGVGGTLVINSRKRPSSPALAKEQNIAIDTPSISVPNSNSSPANSPPPSQSIDKIIDWLNRFDIQVIKSHQTEPGDEVRDRIAWYLGEKTSNPTLDSLYRQLKIGITQNASRYFNFSGRSQKDIALGLEFVRLLKDSTFLNSYYYDKKTKTVRITPPENGEVRNFLTGGWLERYVCQKIIRYLESENKEYQYLINPQLKFSNGDVFEFDLLFWFDNSPLWIECKSGQNLTNNNILTLYSRHQKKLQTDRKNSLIVAYNISSDRSAELGKLWNFTFINQQNVIDGIRPPSTGTTPEMNGKGQVSYEECGEDRVCVEEERIPSSSIGTILRKYNVRPSPECRAIILRELIELISTSEESHTRKEIRDILFERLQESDNISKSKIQEILVALMRQKALIDEEENPIEAHDIPIARLITDDPTILERKCLEEYIQIALRYRANFFKNPQNRQEFLEVIGNGYCESDLADLVAIDPHPV
jgi:hypothetical protein